MMDRPVRKDKRRHTAELSLHGPPGFSEDGWASVGFLTEQSRHLRGHRPCCGQLYIPRFINQTRKSYISLAWAVTILRAKGKIFELVVFWRATFAMSMAEA
jgi:hypothetical protein